LSLFPESKSRASTESSIGIDVKTMNLEEIKSYLLVGLIKSVCIDKRLSPEFPGYVRSIYIHEENRVVIKFEKYGDDDAGAYYWGKFSSLESAIETLEDYLNASLQEWTNYTKTDGYPELPPDLDTSKGHEYLIAAISLREVPLPEKGDFRLKSSYYRQFEGLPYSQLGLSRRQRF